MWKCCESKIFSNIDAWKTWGWTKYKLPWFHGSPNYAWSRRMHVSSTKLCHLQFAWLFFIMPESHILCPPLSVLPEPTVRQVELRLWVQDLKAVLEKGKSILALFARRMILISCSHIRIHLRTIMNPLKCRFWFLFALYSLETFWTSVSQFQHQREVVLHIFKSNILRVHISKQSVHRILCSTAGRKCWSRQQHLQTT